MCLPFYVNQKKSENLSLLVTNVSYCIYMYAEVIVISVSFVLNICSHAADKAHRAGITVFSIGVGGKIQRQTLNTIASNPDCTHVFSVASYTEIKAIKEEIQKSSCQGEQLINTTIIVSIILLSPLVGKCKEGNTECTTCTQILSNKGSAQIQIHHYYY